MGRTCITYEKEEKCIQNFGRKPERKKATRKKWA
jgi:hypothetical protein